MGYYIYYQPKNKIFVARNAEFFENCLIVQEASGSHGLLKMSGSDEGLELIQEEDTQPSKNTSEEHNEVVPIEVEPQNVKVPIRRFARIPQAPDRYGFYVEVKENELGDLNEPPNYKAALSDTEYDKWLEAMNTEMQSMKYNQVWNLVKLPPNGQTIGNYGETFSPIADIRVIRILLAIAMFYDNEIWKMDVKTAFLNGHLSKDVYMVQPEGFVDPKHPNKVCKLQLSIYGLKQASKSWNKRFDIEIKKIGFTQNPNEPCVCLKASGSSVAFIFLALNLEWKTPRRGYTPMMEKLDYRKSEGVKTPSKVQRMQRVPYVLAIGSIMYATAVKTILKYLRNTKDMVLVYGTKPEAEQKKSAKQSTTGTKSEYIVAAEASMEAVWMRKFIDGLGDVVPSNKRPMEMLCDNEPARAIANDPGILKGARHFQRKYHYIREVIQEHDIVLKKVHTDDSVAYPFIKPMSFNKHYEHATAIGIVPASILM
ncbi:retrotransposon protein, putative, ty1-copia subclass [Tanacetum coccineum]